VRYFNRFTPRELRISGVLLNMLTTVSEQKGREKAFILRNPEILTMLQQTAIVQSTESSSRIEQVTASPARFHLLMGDKTSPKNRSEQEIVGYRKALSLIHANRSYMPISTSTVLHLHKELFWFSNLGGKYKNSQNTIIRKEPDGKQEIVFEPVAPYLTSIEMNNLHSDFKSAWEADEFNKLLLIASYILDFSCIHPFLDGNGRTARLLTLLLLYHADFEVGTYVSLEKIVEETKETYYDVLNQSSKRWHENEHDPTPWFEYFVGVILVTAYQRFESNLRPVESKSSKQDQVVDCIKFLPKVFQSRDVQSNLPNVSHATIRLVLENLKKEEKIRCVVKGKDAKWEKTTLFIA
jgi:Fic family protein